MPNLTTNLTEIVETWQFWAAIGTVMMFGWSRFDVTLPDADELSLPLRARSFTTAFRYILASFTYIGCYVGVYAGLLLIASVPEWRDNLLNFLNAPSNGSSEDLGTPTWAAVAATTVVPAMPFVKKIDERLREILQDFASIPKKATIIADEVLDALKEPKPDGVDDNSSLDDIKKAIDSNRARFEQIRGIYSKLKSNRYDKFFKDNKNMDAFVKEFTDGLKRENATDKASGLYVEKKSREILAKATKFLVCAMLVAERTEFNVRERWRNLGIKISRAKIVFDERHILVLAIIMIAVIISCYAAALLFYGIEAPVVDSTGLSISLVALMTGGTATFFIWGFWTFFVYTPPLVVAAGAAQYSLDRQASKEDEFTRIDKIVHTFLTFLASAMLALFMLLVYGIVLPKLTNNEVTNIAELIPWAIPPALVATTFMLFSSSAKTIASKRFETGLYITSFAIVAAIGSVIAWVLYTFVGGDIFTYIEKQGLPRRLFLYLLIIAPACIGACIGWVLSTTRNEDAIGSMVVPAAESVPLAPTLANPFG